MRILFALLFISHISTAANFEYPELQVTPRATKRLDMENKNQGQLINFAPLYGAAALSVLSSGSLFIDHSLAYGDPLSPLYNPNKLLKVTDFLGAMGGAVWLAVGAYMQIQYEPYQDDLTDIQAIKGQSKSDQLTKERLAEESLKSAAAAGERLRWLSAGSLFALNLASGLLTEAPNMKYVALASSALCATTLFFPYRWETVWHEQKH